MLGRFVCALSLAALLLWQLSNATEYKITAGDIGEDITTQNPQLDPTEYKTTLGDIGEDITTQNPRSDATKYKMTVGDISEDITNQNPHLDPTEYKMTLGDIGEDITTQNPYSDATVTPSFNVDEEGVTAWVEGCPRICSCAEVRHFKDNVDDVLIIENCSEDPSAQLSNVFSTYKFFIEGVLIVHSRLFEVPCALLSTLHKTVYWDLSKNVIQIVHCDKLNNILIQLNLSHNALDTIPSYMAKLPALVDLDLSFNDIQTAPHNLSTMSVLAYLRLEHNRLKSFPCTLTGLASLQLLNMSHNSIEKISCDLSKLSALKGLDLSYNRLQTLDCNLSVAPSLSILYLTNNQIKSVPCTLSGMVALQLLDLRNNHLKVFQCTILSARRLALLNLAHNYIETVYCTPSTSPDEHISKNHSGNSHAPLGSTLTKLELSHNMIENVFCHMINFSSLTWLRLNNNNIKHLNCNLSQMTKLKHLYLSSNSFDTLPCSLADLAAVIDIDLRYNHIRTVKCDMSGMTSLLALYLSHNYLETFPCNLNSLPVLVVLFMDFNYIESVDCDISAMSELKALSLNANRLRSFPCKLPHQKLWYLSFNGNNIDTVECDFSNMTLLSTIYMKQNDLHDFPCNLATAPALNLLCLRWNKIRKLPKCPLNFTQVSSLQLEYNQITVLKNGSLYDLPRYKGILLGSNNITIIESDVFTQTRIQEVFLESNNLHVLDSWTVLYAMDTLDVMLSLDYNKLSQFVNHAGSPLTSCSDLWQHRARFWMRYNDIRHFTDVFEGWNIQANTSEQIYHCFEIFHFEKNPLVCDCIDYDVYSAIHNETAIHTQDLTCAAPTSLKGLNPAFIALDQFVCKLFEMCPEPCLCYETPYSNNLSVICDKYLPSELPTELPKLQKTKYLYYLRWENTDLKSVTFKGYLTKTAEAVFSSNLISNVTIDALLSLHNVSKLYLDYNQLQRLPDNITSVTFSSDAKLRFGYNPWVCDCRALITKKWFLKNHESIQDLKHIRCALPPHTKGKLMMYVDPSEMCPHEGPDFTLVFVILGGVIFFLMMALPLVCMVNITRIVRGHERKEWLPMDWDEEVDDGKEFDVFVSYANEDEEYVGEYLIPELEKRGFKVCFHRVHFLGGKSIIDNICECIAKSKKILAFYSENYKQSKFGMFEFNMAMQLDVQNGSNRLITIKDTDLDVDNLQISHPIYFRANSYIIKDEPTFWRNLLYTLPNNTLGEVDPLYAGVQAEGVAE